MNSNEASIPELQLQVESAIADHEQDGTRTTRNALRVAIRSLTAATYQQGYQVARETPPVTCLADLIEDDGHV